MYQISQHLGPEAEVDAIVETNGGDYFRVTVTSIDGERLARRIFRTRDEAETYAESIIQ